MANYSDGFNYIWVELPVLVTFESDWQKAKKILTEILEKNVAEFSSEAKSSIKSASEKLFLPEENTEPLVYTSVKDSGILLSLRMILPPRKRRYVEEKIWEAILIKFGEVENIDFAYPTTRYYNNVVEGKTTNNK